LVFTNGGKRSQILLRAQGKEGISAYPPRKKKATNITRGGKKKGLQGKKKGVVRLGFPCGRQAQKQEGTKTPNKVHKESGTNEWRKSLRLRAPGAFKPVGTGWR